MRKQLLLLVLISFSVVGYGGKPKRKLEALRINEPVRIDGVLSEDLWATGAIASDFVTYSPTLGQVATQKTEVRVVYNNRSVYFGINCFDTAPDSILKELTKRDERMGGNTDKFRISLNPYNDGQNLFYFEITAANVQSDSRETGHSWRPDMSWNAVWYSEVKITDQGYTAEIEIPFAALRFPNTDVQKWGINFKRTVRRTREETTWNIIDRTFSEASQVGELVGINNIDAPVRLELFPYISLYGGKRPEGNDYGYSAGMDLKYGLNESFTLDMTLIPDFGQRKSDMTILNLTPFETKYQENRAFFNEGTELFEKAGLFYSRRIGSQPEGYYSVIGELNDNEEIVENPVEAKLINATKISGRNSGNLGIGMLNAMTGNTYARIRNPELEERKELTEAFTNYNMIVLDQIIGQNSFINLTNTNVYRPSKRGTANVTGTAIQIMDKENTYGVKLKSAISMLNDSAMVKADRGHLVDLSFGKFGGNFSYNYAFQSLSDDYDPNDMGYLPKNNYMSHVGTIEYRKFEQSGIYNNWSVKYSTAYNKVFAPREFSDIEMELEARTMFVNYWDVKLEVKAFPLEQNDYYEARTPDRVYIRPESYQVKMNGSTDFRKPFAIRFDFSHDGAKDERTGYSYSISPIFRINDNFSFTYKYESNRMNNENGFAELISTDSIVFGKRDIRRITNNITGSYIFSNKSYLSIAARHYWSVVDYEKYYLLNNVGSLEEYNSYGGNEDLNFNIFTIDLVYSWNFAPGSFLNIVWKNNIYKNDTVVDNAFPDFSNNLRSTLKYPQSNILSVKFIYYFNYNKFQKKI